MEPITSETILILAGSFLCVFLSLVTLGGSFLYWRTRQINNSPLPEPTPPAVTRDVHAKPLGETPTRDEPVDEPEATGRPRVTRPFAHTKQEPPVIPMEPEPPTIQAAITPPPLHLPPLGVEPHQHERTEVLSVPDAAPLGVDFDTINEADDGSETVTRELSRPPVRHLTLPNPSDNDTTPTVIINRNPSILDEDEEES